MEVEYLDEDESIVSIIDDTNTNNDEYNYIVTSQTTESNIERSLYKESNNLQKIVRGKENIDKTLKNYKIKKDNQQCIAKFDKSIEQSDILLKNANSTQNTESNKEERTPLKTKRNTPSEQLKNSIEVSAHLNSIYEKTYELKKSYYESKLKYQERLVEAVEKATNVLEHFFH